VWGGASPEPAFFPAGGAQTDGFASARSRISRAGRNTAVFAFGIGNDRTEVEPGRRQRAHIDEVARFAPPDQRTDLVGGDLASAVQANATMRLDHVEVPRPVDDEVHHRAFLPALRT
jgi:hypothetical protein